MSELGRDRDGPMHEAFGLTYASYLVWPRSFIQEMPAEWQRRLRELLDEMNEVLDCSGLEYRVQKLGENGRFVSDPYRDYRRGPTPPRAPAATEEGRDDGR